MSDSKDNKEKPQVNETQTSNKNVSKNDSKLSLDDSGNKTIKYLKSIRILASISMGSNLTSTLNVV